MNHINRRKAATLFVITALFASILAIPTATQAAAIPAAFNSGTIVFDYSHGQESSSGTVVALDAFLDANLTAMGFDVVWARGGINATILDGAVAFVAGSIYGAGNGYLAAEITAIEEWFNAGNKFMWIGYDSDYTSAPDAGQFNNENMTLILEAVGSHVYGEPAAIEDPISSAGSGYRAIANTTTTNLDLAAFVQGVTNVMMHGPTLLYGASGDSTTDPVALETNTIENVYPLLFYGGNATIMNGDLIDPIAHDEGDVGSFVASTLELKAGTDGSSALVVSGASPYGDYRPMFTDLYYNVTMDGNMFVKNTLKYGIFAATATQGEGKIVFDYSHGQKSSSGTVAAIDAGLRTALFLKGYETYWAMGGINATILEDAVAFIAGSIYGAGNAYLAAEITAIEEWFNAGRKFMWIGYDSDYTSAPDAGQFNNENMTLILEAVGSHVYGEPAAIEDPISSAGSGYRAIANTTSEDAFVADLVKGVTTVMMHGPTLLYGASGDATTDPVALETNTIVNVYPVLYYGANATIMNGDLIDPIAHDEGDIGSFVAMTLEVNAGAAGTGLLVVSGASPYGDYRPMYTDLYYGVEMDGYNLVLNTIDFGIANIPAAGFVLDTTTLLIIGGVAVVIIIIIVVIKKR